MFNLKKIFFFIFCISFFFHYLSYAALSNKIHYKAKNYSFDPLTQKLILSGGIDFGYGEDKVQAEKAEIDIKNKIITVEGQVLLKISDGTEISAQKVIYHYDTQLAKIFEGRVTQGSSILVASEVDKVGPKKYKLTNGYWTSCQHCEDESPDWRIWGLSTTATIEEYGFVTSPVLYIKGLPVFWLPFLILPIKNERQSGLLFPKHSFSDNHGWAFLNQFFLALTPHQDMTFSHHWYEKRGQKYGLEYRLTPAQNFSAVLNSYYLNDRKYGKIFPERRGAAFYRHSWDISKNWSHKFKAAWLSDADYPDDFSKEVSHFSGETPLEKSSASESNFFVSWHTPYSNLTTEAVYYQNLLSAHPRNSNQNTVHKLPELGLFIHSLPFSRDLPLYFNLESSYAHFSNLGKNDFIDGNNNGQFDIKNEQDILLKAHRLDLFPRLILPFHMGKAFEFIPEVGYRDTRYLKGASQGWGTRSLFRFRTNLLTNFEKIFYFPEEKEVKASRHSVEPRLEWTYIPRIETTGLPQFDSVDQIEASHKISYFLSSWLHFKNVSLDESNKKETHTYPKALEFRLFQTLDLKRVFNHEKNPWEDLTAKLQLDFLHFDASIENIFDGNRLFLKNNTTSFTISDSFSNSYTLSHNYVRDTSHNVSFGVNLNFIEWLKLYGTSNYSLTSHQFLEHKAGFQILPTSQCWMFKMDLINTKDRGWIYTVAFEIIFSPESKILLIDPATENPHEFLTGSKKPK
ncbi:MAG: LPS-assembly protein LptD [Deltaproteobacteria bacterium]|nr:LPS-assembly protein LptD [Deltaproteobacteria bacterium]